MPKTMNVTCRCGQVQLSADREPIATICCYCNSCRAASTAFAQLPGAPSAVRPDGGTDYVLFRKDRVTCVAGAQSLAEHRLKPESPTRRIVATCCNTPLFLDFTRGHWLSVYRIGVEPADRPAVQLGVMAKDRASPPEPGSALPTHPSFPPGLAFRMIRSWAAMGFRRPPVDYVQRRLAI